MSPVTREPMPRIPKPMVVIRASGSTLEWNSISDSHTHRGQRMQGTIRPTDHLPKGVFGKILIRMFITTSPTQVQAIFSCLFRQVNYTYVNEFVKYKMEL